LGLKEHRTTSRITRRSFLARTSSVLAPLAIAGVAGKQKRTFAAASDIGGRAKRGRVVILGFDGVEPTLIDGMLKSGALPNLLALQNKGNYQRLLSSNGYLAVAGQTNAETAFNEAKYIDGYDWSQSRAYGLGLGSIFLNLKSREGRGRLGGRDVGDRVGRRVRSGQELG